MEGRLVQPAASTRPKVIYMAEMGPILWEVWRPLVFLFGTPVDRWDRWVDLLKYIPSCRAILRLSIPVSWLEWRRAGWDVGWTETNIGWYPQKDSFLRSLLYDWSNLDVSCPGWQGPHKTGSDKEFPPVIWFLRVRYFFTMPKNGWRQIRT